MRRARLSRIRRKRSRNKPWRCADCLGSTHATVVRSEDLAERPFSRVLSSARVIHDAEWSGFANPCIGIDQCDLGPARIALISHIEMAALQLVAAVRHFTLRGRCLVGIENAFVESQ